MRRLVGFRGLAAALVFLGPGAAWAGDPSDTERARALFDEAGALERQGKWGAAEDRLRQALKLRETPQLYYAYGWALENEDKLLEARTEYEKAVSLAVGKPNAEEAARLAKERIGDLEKMTPTIRVKIGGAKPNARVTVDGREAKREDDSATVAVNPGSHVLRVERGGNEDAVEQMVYVARKETKEIVVDAPSSVAVRDTDQDRRAAGATQVGSRTTDAPVLPWVLLGGGVALLGGSTALFVASHANANDRDLYQSRWCKETSCSGGTTATRPETAEALVDRRAATDAASSGNTKQVAGFLLGGVGVVGAAVGTWLLLTSKHDEKASVAGVTYVPGGAVATAAGRF